MAVNRKVSPEDFASIARSFPILESVSDAGLKALARLAVCHDYPKNNILFYQGDPGSQLLLVLSGRVKITIASEEGREVILASVGPGEFCGLVSAVDGGAHPGNAITVEPSRLARFDATGFGDWLDGQPEMQRALLMELGRRVRLAYGKIGEHALLGVKERLLYALLDIAESEGTPDPGSEVIIFTRPTHQELANRIGSSREVVSRLLKQLLQSDLLQAEGRVIRVPESALILRED